MKVKGQKHSELKASKVAHILDKNSRTMTKIIQLVESLQVQPPSDPNSDDVKAIRAVIGMV